MRSVTAQFSETIVASHRLALEVSVISPSATTVVPCLEGSVTIDQTSAVRGRCDLSISPLQTDGTTLIPSRASDLVTVYGNEVQVKRGVTYADGTTEMVSLGIFGIQDVDIQDDGKERDLPVVGLDRAQRFIDARFEDPYSVTAGTNFGTAILAVLQADWPSVPHVFTSTAYTTPALVATEGSDRWKFAQDMAAAISMDLYFDGDGVLLLKPRLSSSAVMTLAEGTNGVLVEVGRKITRAGTFNAVIATGENTGEAGPSRGRAFDSDPLSPTYYYGPFGKVPKFYSSPFLTTNAQALAAASKTLADELGITEQVDFGSFVLPHLEPSDVVRITRLASGVDEDHIIDSLTIPLDPQSAMSGLTRARQI